MRKMRVLKPVTAFAIAILVLFSSAPVLNSYGLNGPPKGDTANEVVTVEENGVKVVKTLSKTATEGVYNIRFDVTGALAEIDETQPLNVVVVFDTSGSMNEAGTNPAKWNNAKNGAIALSQALVDRFSSTGVNLSLVTFAKTANVAKNWSVNAFTLSDFPSLPNDGTNIQDGLVKAAELLAGKENNVVVLVGDGIPTFYTNGSGNISGDGMRMSTDIYNATMAAASALKSSGTTVLTLGYSVPVNGEAESVLKEMASSPDFYSAADPNSVGEALMNMVAKITENGIGSNAVLTDVIGQQFTYVGSDDAVTVSGDTVSFPLGELTDETKSFSFDVEIDPDSETGWYDTNEDARVDYTDFNGESQRLELADSPRVYWLNQGAGEFVIKKVDADNPGKTLEGAEFELLSNGKAMSFRQEASGKYVADSGLSTTTAITTGKDGLASVSELPLGVYTLRETKAPAAYYTASSDVWTVDVSLQHSDANGWINKSTITTVTDKNGANCFDGGAVTIKNQYGILTGAQVELVGRKILAGAELKGNMFVFTVKDTNGNVVSMGTNRADGTILFDAIRYTKAGSYHYNVTEANTHIDGMDYDNKVVPVTVNVKDNGDGTLTATPVYPEGGIVFSNSYRGTQPAGGTVTLNLYKMLVDSEKSLVGTGKSFPVFIMDENFELVARVNITANIGVVSINGLEGGKTYYLYEAGSTGYDIQGYEIFEKTVDGSKVVGISLPQIPDNMVGSLSLTVVNRTDNVLEIPDDEVPQFIKPKDDDIELIEIGEEEIPLSPGPESVPVTGDAFRTNVLLGVGGAALLGLTTAAAFRKRKTDR